MRFDILTLFPSMIRWPFEEGVIGKAIKKGKIELHIHNIRQYADDPHGVVDDYPYGGGEGMVLKVEPIVRAIESLQKIEPKGHVILLTPQGRSFNQKEVIRLSIKERIILICGRYEGVDERVTEGGWVDEEISIGDYVLTGGELPAMVVVEAVARLIPGVIGNQGSLINDSFQEDLLKYPQYTRPPEFRGLRVPDILFSGHHERIKMWRRREALKRTLLRRPDLIQRASLSETDMAMIEEIKMEIDREGTSGVR
jgi:tRNA (guanine37-N1)-methyltransferase